AEAPRVPSRREYVAAAARDFEQHRGVLTDEGTEPRPQQPGAAPGVPPLQLLERNDDGVLATMVQQVETPAGPHRVVTFIVLTAVGDTRLFLNFYGPDSGPEALRPVRDAAVAYLASVVAANPEPSSHRVWFIAGAVVALVLVGGAAFVWLRQRRRPA